MEPLIGRSVPRREDFRFLTGAGRFSDDFDIDGQAYACFVRSPHAHARVLEIDVAAARAAPGVLAVLTGADYLADGNGGIDHLLMGVDYADTKLPAFPDEAAPPGGAPPHVPIASDRVRHVGDPVAMVVAETLAAALDAAELVAVDYEPLPAVVGARDALKPDAPVMFDSGNQCIEFSRGDPAATEAAFANADHVVRLDGLSQRISAIPLEPRAATAEIDPETGIATLHAQSQGVHKFKLAVMTALNMPPDKLRVVTRDVGGGFGARSCANGEYPLLVWAAQRTARPVKWTATRSETFVSDYQARDTAGDAALALDKDGRILGIRIDYVTSLGAYPVSFAIAGNLQRLAGGPYDVHAVHMSGRGAVTNTVPVSVYRGAGRPEVTFLVERMLDIAAGELGIDRIEIRRRNLIPPEGLPFQTPLGPRFDSGAFIRNLENAAAAIDWDGFAARRAAAEGRGMLAGIGIATYLEAPSGAPMERADIRVRPDGRIVAVVGTQSSGQGHETVFAQVVADTLQVPEDRIDIEFGDTDRSVSGGGTHSDRSMRLGGTVLVKAGDKIIARAREIAAHVLEAAATDIEYAAGRFRVAGTDREVDLFSLAALAAAGDVPEEFSGPLDAADIVDYRLPAHPNGVAACEIEIDPETGALRVVRYATVDDVGRLINPVIVEGQIHGGIAQGLGQALFEHNAYDAETGQILAGSFMDYCLPRADDLPSFDIAPNNDCPAPSNPLGVKGAGEAGTTPATSALVSAVVDALHPYGVAHIETPVTSEKIFRAIRKGAG
jgi:carbon-monoxide dehydrogenase large subunit